MSRCLARRMRLARWLREQRHMHDLTVPDVAQYLGVDVSTVYNCERGDIMPRFDNLDRWLTLLGVDLLDTIGAVE